MTQLLSATGFNRLMSKVGFGAVRTADQETPARTPSELAGQVVMIAVLLFASIEALQLLEFETLATLLAGLTVFLGKVALGVLVFAAGLYLAELAASTIRSSGLAQSNLLAVTARSAITILAAAMALRQMDVAEDIINMAFGLTLGALAIAAAVAFGIGGRDIAKRYLERLEASARRGEPGPQPPTQRA